MKKSINLFILSLLISISLSGQSEQLTVEKSEFKWTGKAAFNSYALSGTLEADTCMLNVNNNEISTAELVIDMQSLDSDIADLTRHLRSKDFFEVDQFTTATFILTNTLALREGKQQATGTVKIKEQSHSQEFEIELLQDQNNWLLKGQLKIDRTQYGIFYNSPNVFKNLKEQAIADEFVLDFSILLTTSKNVN